jgi:uncharacterized iron-regulated membrane protein
MSSWRAWKERPQTLFLRKAIFQIHLWTGLMLALYVVVISLSGSILVYRSDLEVLFAPKPRLVAPGATLLSEDELSAAAQRMFPQYQVREVHFAAVPNQAADVELTRNGKTRKELLNPYTGEDLGYAVPAGFRFTDWLLDFHDNLLGGPTGRRVNGVAGALVVLSGLTGLVIWWPGIRRWRRNLLLDLRSGWRQTTWSLHSVFGFWFVGFVVMWGFTGVYLAYHEVFDHMVGYLEPFAGAERFGDRVLYWIGYAHFGRFGGRIPGCGRGACNETFKAIWALAAIVPILLAVTGAILWWNRSGSRFFRRATSSD